MTKIRLLINLWRTATLFPFIRKEFAIDSIRWSVVAGAQPYQDNQFWLFCFLMIYYHEYRNVLEYRVRDTIKGKFVKLLFPNVESILILNSKDTIGEGLQLGHRTSIVLNAEKIGKNFLIFQQTTVGASNGSRPTFGNNVTIYPGAKVFGGITIGDGAVIGANAVVTKDVPTNAVVAGVPAVVIKYITDSN